MTSYPLKFEPILKEKVWGGNKLKTNLNKETTSSNVGESWEISGVLDNISTVKNGCYKGQTLNKLLHTHTEEFLGAKNYSKFGNQFPLLVKFLDAKTNLSVQVHPDDKLASQYNSFGKTEMWYIMDCDENAEIILGMKESCKTTEVLRTIDATNVYDVFNAVTVNKGDHYFIPAGEVHAIGSGILAAEIQQTSDITYRVYDWNRTDKKGNTRQLHTEQAIAATKMNCKKEAANTTPNSSKNSSLVTCEYFTTNMLHLHREVIKNYEHLDSFIIFMCVEGTATIATEDGSVYLNAGNTTLVPACSKEVKFYTNNAKLLEVYIAA